MAHEFEAAYCRGKRLFDARAERAVTQGELDALLVKLKDADTREEERTLRLEIDVKRSALDSAQARVRDGERAMDFYVISNRRARG
jgi:hypothetical protein